MSAAVGKCGNFNEQLKYLETGASNARTDFEMKFIKHMKFFEGFRPTRYICPGGRSTIGYGFTSDGLEECKRYGWDGMERLPDSITKIKADAHLRNMFYPAFATIVDDAVKVPLTIGQRFALISFTYNLGRGALDKILNKPGRINDGNYNIDHIWRLYRTVNGKILQGLVKRREDELTQFWNA